MKLNKISVGCGSSHMALTVKGFIGIFINAIMLSTNAQWRSLDSNSESDHYVSVFFCLVQRNVKVLKVYSRSYRNIDFKMDKESFQATIFRLERSHTSAGT